MKAYITIKEAAELISVSMPTMYKLASRPGCPVKRHTPRGKIYFNPEQLKAWVDRHG